MANTGATGGATADFAVRVTLLAVMALPMMAFAPLSPALPAISAHFADVPNIDYLSRFVLTVPAIFIALLSPAAGFLVDRFGRKRLLLGSITLYGVSGLSGAAFDSLPLLLASRGVIGIAMAGILTATTTLVGDYFAGQERQRFLGLRGAFVNYTAVFVNVLGGLIATFVMRVSLARERPRVAVTVAKHHHTWTLIEESRCFGLHLLCEDNLEMVWKFGLATARDTTKFVGTTHRTEATGSPILDDTIGWLDCRVEARLDIGDRTIYVAEVIDGDLQSQESPLTLYRLLELAPPDKQTKMAQDVLHDSAVDTKAIDKWRGRDKGGG